MRIHCIIVFCITIATSNAQTFDDAIRSNRYIDCRDVTFNAVAIIEKLYVKDEIDSIYQFIDYWEQKCGHMESTFRLRTILDIRTGQFEPDSISSSLIEYLLAYKTNREYSRAYFHLPNQPFDLISHTTRFDSLTQQIASASFSSNVDASLVLDFYSAESPTFENIRSAPEESRLRALHHEDFAQTLRQPQVHAAFITGLVQHYGFISIFGDRPHFGFLMGAKHGRHLFDLILDFRAGPSKEEYSFVYQDSLITGDKWTGMYLGLEYTFDFVRTPQMDIGLSPAIGYDRITALTVENDYGEDAMFLSSFNKNVGLVLKYKFGKNGGYLGVHLRYNWADYKNPGGTRLDGQYFNVRLTIGSIANFWRDSRLRSLE